MANGSGVSMSRLDDGKWRVRWRDRVEVDGKTAWKSRERVVNSEQAAIDLRSKVLRSIETEGLYVDPRARVTTAPTVETLLVEYIKASAAQGLEVSTIETMTRQTRFALRCLRKVHGIDEGAPVSASLLSRASLVDLINVGRATEGKNGPVTEKYLRASVDGLLAVWREGYEAREHLADRGGIPLPPSSVGRLLPRRPKKVAPAAPTLAEVDACIRHIPGGTRLARGAAIVMRYTGLRISQVLNLQRDDLDTTAKTLTVRTGKSEIEKAEAEAGLRVLPVSDAFLRDVAPHLGPAGGSLLRRMKNYTGHGKPKGLVNTVRAGWEAATEAGQARRAVWHVPGRKIARPDHAFRAALQHALEEARVPGEAIDAIVGHHETTRSKHYVSDEARFAAMREAIDALPGIDWAGPEEQAYNVVAFPA